MGLDLTDNLAGYVPRPLYSMHLSALLTFFVAQMERTLDDSAIRRKFNTGARL